MEEVGYNPDKIEGPIPPHFDPGPSQSPVKPVQLPPPPQQVQERSS